MSDWQLSLFGKRSKVAVGNYQDFVEKINIAAVDNPAGNLGGGLIFGSSDFVDWVKETFLAKRSEKREIQQLTAPRSSVALNASYAYYPYKMSLSISRIIAGVAMQLEKSNIQSPSK
jgi:hypothetical protein